MVIEGKRYSCLRTGSRSYNFLKSASSIKILVTQEKSLITNSLSSHPIERLRVRRLFSGSGVGEPGVKCRSGGKISNFISLLCNCSVYLLLTMCLLVISAEQAEARPGRKPFNRKLFVDSERQSPGLALYSFESSFNDFIHPRSRQDGYDSNSLHRLQLLHQDAAPLLNPDDFDLDRTRRATTKALMMEGGHSVSMLVHNSELGSIYRSALRSFKRIQSQFRYSIQESHTGYEVAREKRGKKIIELDLQFDIKRGVDPQLTFWDTIHFRYDPIYKRAIIGYDFRF